MMINKSQQIYFLLQLLIVGVTIVARVVEAETTDDHNEAFARSTGLRRLQAGSYGGSSSSSSGGSTGSYIAAGAALGFLTQSTGGRIILGVIAVVIVAAIVYKCIRRKMANPESEDKFFQQNNQGEATDGESENFDETLFYSGLYEGFYVQNGTQMPIQPFHLKFLENFDVEDVDDSGPLTIFHTITGEGADMVGPYSLSGKSVGNKISITKRYYSQGNLVTDIGHEVTLRLEKLGDTHLFEGKYYVNTDEVQENGLYQIWPVGYNQQQPPPPQMYEGTQQTNNFDLSEEEKQKYDEEKKKYEATSDEENQQQEIPVAEALSVVSEEEPSTTSEFQTIPLGNNDEKKSKD